MDLEFATTADIVKELRDRKMRFVMVGVENSNQDETNPVFLAGQAAGPEEMVKLIELGRDALTTIDDDFPWGMNLPPEDETPSDSTFFSEFREELAEEDAELGEEDSD